MFDHIADFTAWPILTGILIGYIANRIMSGEGKGCCMNLIIGIIGSYAGTFISHLLNIELRQMHFTTTTNNTLTAVCRQQGCCFVWGSLFPLRAESRYIDIHYVAM